MDKVVHRIASVVLIVLLLLTLTACNKETPEESMSNVLEALKVFDIETMDKYSELADISNITSEKTKKLFENLSYSILSTEENDASVKVTVEITNVDMNLVSTDYLVEVMSYGFGTISQFTEEELTDKLSTLLVGLIDKNKENKTTRTVTIELVEVDGKWQIAQLNNEVINALTGGVLEATGKLPK